MRVADQRVARRDQAGGQHVALGGVAVALGHQAGGGGQRQPAEPAVVADRVEMRRVGAEPVVSQDALDRDLHARVVLALLGGQPRVDLEVRVLERDDLGGRGTCRRERRPGSPGRGS